MAELAAVLALVVAAAALAFPDGLPPGGGDAAEPRLVLSQADPLNGPLEMRRNGNSEQPTLASMPQVDLTVRNTGTARGLLTGARVTIEDSAHLDQCYVPGGGDVPAAPPEVFVLPELPLPRERTMDRPLHRQIARGAVDRVVLAFSSTNFADDHLYALHVELSTDDPDVTIDAGRYVLAVPGPISRSGTRLPEDDTMLASAGTLTLVQTWCYRANLAALRRIVAREGKRSADVAALERVRPAPSWEKRADPTPAAEAVPRLLEDAEGPGPLLAVFAAETARDAALAEKTRTEAAALLLRRAEERVDGGGWAAGAVADARASLSLAPSAHAEQVLEQAERIVESNGPPTP